MNFIQFKYTKGLQTGINEEQFDKLEEICQQADKKWGDSGTCVLGLGLYVKDKGGDWCEIIGQWCQGNLAPEDAMRQGRDYLEAEGFDVRFDYGRMD